METQEPLRNLFQCIIILRMILPLSYAAGISYFNLRLLRLIRPTRSSVDSLVPSSW